MGNCKSKKNKIIKPLGETELLKFNSIKELTYFFDKVSLEQLNFPDVSVFLAKLIKRNRIVGELKAWVVVNEVSNILNSKTICLIRNFNPESDAAIQLIYLLKQLIQVSLCGQELQTSFNEQAVELFQYYQAQLVQISLEILLAVNTLINKQEPWWDDNYFEWRGNYIQSMFKVKRPEVERVDYIYPFHSFAVLLKECIKSLCNSSKSPDLGSIDIKAQQEILEQFYTQMRTCFVSNQSTMWESINCERQVTSKELDQKLQTYTLLIKKNNAISPDFIKQQ